MFLSAGFYLAYMFVPPYAGFYMLKIDAEEEAGIAHMYSDEELASRITRKAASWSIPLGPENLEITRGSEDITIEVNYAVNLSFFDLHERELVYHIEVKEPLKETDRVLQ